MTRPSFNGPPTPEDLQKQVQEFMRQHFQTGASPFAKSEFSPAGEAQPEETTDSVFRFDKRPREVKSFLDRFVIKQDEAKKVLSVAICDHYHHVRMALEGRQNANYAKQNIILLGPTGVGKTYLIRSAADLIGV